MMQPMVLHHHTSTSLHCTRRWPVAPRTIPNPANAHRKNYLPTRLHSPRRILVRAQQSEDADEATNTSSQEQGSNDDVTNPPPAPTPPTDPPSLHAAAALLATQLRAVLDAALGFVKLVFSYITQGAVWARQRRLKKLAEAAEQTPNDPAVIAAYVVELAAADPKGVVRFVEGGQAAVDSVVAVEYVKALVKSGEVEKYAAAEGISTGSYVSFAQLLQALTTRLTGEGGAVNPGETVNRPLHVVVQQPAQPPLIIRTLFGILTALSLYIGLSVAWLVGSTLIRRHSNGMSLSSQLSSSSNSRNASTSGNGGGAYAPKEYSKDNIPEKSVKTFSDVKGCDEAKAELEEIVEYLKNPEKFTRLGGKLPKGVLLTGPPGTGKTLLAKATAGEAGVPFFYRAGSEFEEMFVGVGSRRVRSLFTAAKKKSPCIVFIDEIDAIGGSRKHWENHTRKTLNQLLVEMDGFESNEGVIVMACTNIPEALDPALTRPGRFDRIVAVPLPDVRGRQQILQLYLENKPVLPEVDAEYLARNTPGFSGAELFNMVNEAALIAAKSHADAISNSMLDEARDKVLMGSPRKSMVQSKETRRLTAYHEAGHAIVALNTKGATPIHKATIMPRGHALGYVSMVPEADKHDVTKMELLAGIDVCMGGRVAEELIFGEEHVTTGAVNDLQQATSSARNMVASWGMSDAVGPLYVGTGGGHHDAASSATKIKVDTEVTKLLNDSIGRVRALLNAKRQDLHTLAAALLEHETLTLDDIKTVLQGKPLRPSTPDSPSGSTPLHHTSTPTTTSTKSTAGAQAGAEAGAEEDAVAAGLDVTAAVSAAESGNAS